MYKIEYSETDTIPSEYQNVELVREDSNGTKTFSAVEHCVKCGGTGYITYYNHVENGVCFDCDGSGWHHLEFRVLTESYLAKLEERRAKKAEKDRQKRIKEHEESNRETIESLNFKDGKAYLCLGNTFLIKEQLKELGGKWRMSSWFLPTDTDLCETLELKEDEIFIDYNELGELMYNSIEKRIQAKIDEYFANKTEKEIAESKSVHVGNVGDRLQNIEMTLVHESASFETRFGTMSFYTFMDNDGNEYSWCTGSTPMKYVNTGVINKRGEEVVKPKFLRDGDKFVMKSATIKEHSEYNGIKQTVLTRCKLDF